MSLSDCNMCHKHSKSWYCLIDDETSEIDLRLCPRCAFEAFKNQKRSQHGSFFTGYARLGES